MRFRNDGPLTLYVVIDTETGNVASTENNLRLARAKRDWHNRQSDHKHVVLKYDQRGF